MVQLLLRFLSDFNLAPKTMSKTATILLLILFTLELVHCDPESVPKPSSRPNPRIILLNPPPLSLNFTIQDTLRWGMERLAKRKYAKVSGSCKRNAICRVGEHVNLQLDHNQLEFFFKSTHIDVKMKNSYTTAFWIGFTFGHWPNSCDIQYRCS